MKIKAETIVRLMVLILALVNQCLTAAGLNPLPFDDEMIGETVSLCITIAAAAWAWWKNNSFTAAAIAADEVLAEMKTEKKG